MNARLLSACVLLAAACKNPPPCATMPEMNELLTQAALVRVDVYDGTTVHCNGAVADGLSPPLLSHTFPGHSAVRLDLPPGQRTIVMTTYSDSAGVLAIGSACTEANLSGGHAACLSLSLVAITTVGCGSDVDCAAPDGGTTSRPHCDPRQRHCVECVATSDCGPGQACSPAGQCASQCESGICPNGRTCCDGFCVDTNNDSLNCGGCGMPCGGGQRPCCNSQCVDATTSVQNCGGCGNVCDTTNSTAPACPANTCLYETCPAGRADCNRTAPNLDGCECATPLCCGNACQPTHLNGLGQTFLLDCTPLGTPGDETTYSLQLATAARDASPAGVDGNKSCGNGAMATNCLTRTSGTMCATWCYGKALAGRVLQATTCTCPSTSSPAWN